MLHLIHPSRRAFLAQSAGLFAAPLFAQPDAPRGLVTGQLEAAEAGKAVLAAGGNAMDAIVAAALVAGVVALPSTGIGGYGGHLVGAKPGGKPFAIDFNTTAPAAAKADMFKADEQGKVEGNAHLHGWLAAGVPGVLAGLQLALDKHGTRSFTTLVEPAITFARDGFKVTKGVAAAIKAALPRFAKDAGSAKLFLKNGEPLAEGELFRNPDLATLLETLAAKGRVDDFYTGKTAEKIAAAFKQNGGLVTANDLGTYRATKVEPASLEWRGFTMFTPPPTAGGITALQALSTLKALGWEKWDTKDPKTTQAKVEALRIAWTDRLKYFGDSLSSRTYENFFLSDEYVEESVKRVRTAIADRKPVRGNSDGRSAGGTIHLCAVDQSGFTVALTFTHGESFGAQVTVDGLGLVLGHGVSRFDPRPDRANSIVPRRRPLHNMCPTVVMKDDNPVLALGATGGRRIPNTVFDVLAYRIGAGLPLAEAVKAPRMHTDGDPTVTLEAAWPTAMGDHLKAIGYTVKTGGAANLNAIERDAKTGELTAAAR